MIVKVQISLVTTERRPQVLIYNKRRDVEWMGDASEELLALMAGSVKRYFFARVVDTKIVLDSEVPACGW